MVFRRGGGVSADLFQHISRILIWVKTGGALGGQIGTAVGRVGGGVCDDEDVSLKKFL